MSDPENLEAIIRQLEDSLRLHYSASVAHNAAALYMIGREELRVYIIGCLLLTLTASVHPKYTLLSHRAHTIARRRQSAAAATAPSSPSSASQSLYPFSYVAEAYELASAGLFFPPEPAADDADRAAAAAAASSRPLVCFHCSSKVAASASPLDALAAHRAASPSCYYVRLLDFVASAGTDPRLVDGLERDIGRYVKALRKLKNDLRCAGFHRAESYGFPPRLLQFCATRHFMRNSGEMPHQAGDLIALVYTFEDDFHASIPATVGVAELLAPLKMLLPPAPAPAPAPGAAAASAGASNSSSSASAPVAAAARQAAATSRSESGYHSVIVGRYDAATNTYVPTQQVLSDNQYRALQAVLSGEQPAQSHSAGSSSS